MRLFYALALLCLCAVDCGQAEADTAACTLTRVLSLPLTVTPGHALTVPASLEGHDVSLQIDTGSSYTTLIEGAATAMGLKIQHYFGAYSYGLGGAANLGSALVHDFRLGDAHSEQLTMAVTSVNHEYRAGDPVGLLGADFLHHYDLDFDVANHTLSLFLHDHCPNQVVYWKPDMVLDMPFTLAPDHRIETKVQMDQEVLPCILDTGASTSLVGIGQAEKLGLNPATMGFTVINKLGAVGDDPVKAYSYRLPNMILGDETLRNFEIAIADESNMGIMRSADRVLLGADFILQNHVYISFDDRTIFFSPYKYRVVSPSEIDPSRLN